MLMTIDTVNRIGMLVRALREAGADPVHPHGGDDQVAQVEAEAVRDVVRRPVSLTSPHGFGLRTSASVQNVACTEERWLPSASFTAPCTSAGSALLRA